MNYVAYLQMLFICEKEDDQFEGFSDNKNDNAFILHHMLNKIV